MSESDTTLRADDAGQGRADASHSSGEAIYATDARGTMTAATRALVDLVGAERAVGRRAHDVLHGAAVEHAHACPFERAQEGTFRDIVRTKDGSRVAVTATCLPIPGGRVVTLREEARGGSAQFNAFLEAAPDAMVIADGAGRIAHVNAQAVALFGYARSELVGERIEILLPHGHRADREAQRGAHGSAPRVRPLGAEVTLHARRKDGTEFPVEISLAPISTSEGMLFMSAIRDVTARRAMEQELAAQADALAKSNAELQQFAFVASHDLQEPLRMVAGYVQLLERRYGGKLDREADEFIAHAVQGTERMRRLILGLLEFSRLDSRSREKGEVESSLALADALRNLGSAVAESGAVITWPDLPRVNAERSQLALLFQNLVGNAIKFRGDAEPRIRVAAQRESDAWHFTVNDNGIGIAPEHHERVFVIFQRLHTRDRYPGTGMGLAICRKIVDRHGGRIWVDSEEGRGATFHFTLPVGVGRP